MGAGILVWITHVPFMPRACWELTERLDREDKMVEKSPPLSACV